MNLPLVEFAPMEGITDGIFREVHRSLFDGIDRYYTPFLSPTGGAGLTVRDRRLIEPVWESVVPQLLTKRPEDFCDCARVLRDMGFREVNLNLGCPSGTVVAKGKGAALLGNGEQLEALLEGIFQNACCPVSLKTRLGLHDPAEFQSLLAIYRKYPLCRLIVHPRTRDELYSGAPHLELLDTCDFGAIPISVNGSFLSAAEVLGFADAHPTIDTVMVGRGLIADPAMARELKGGAPLTAGELWHFADTLSQAYTEAFQSQCNASFRMKELWFYFSRNFDAPEKPLKEIRHAKTLPEIQAWGKRLIDGHAFRS